ncbi:MAG: hypothetical protein ACRDEB_03800 [Chitinophagaceae bacterium]
MEKNITEEEIKKEELRITKMKFLYDHHLKFFDQSMSFLYKGYAFLLAILAVLTGYLFSQKSDSNLKQYVGYLGICLSSLAILAGIFIGFNILGAAKKLNQIVEAYDKYIYKKLELNFYYRNGRIYAIIALLCGILSIVTFLIAFFALKNSNYSNPIQLDLPRP